MSFVLLRLGLEDGGLFCRLEVVKFGIMVDMVSESCQKRMICGCQELSAWG